MYRWGLMLVLGCLASGPAAAVDVYAFQTPEQEHRFNALSAQLRCPKCLSTNLESSDAPIAQDLKDQIYTQILGGRSDAEILDFMRARYGDFILYEPRLTASTWLLWFGPLLMLGAGLALLWRLRLAGSAKQDEPQ